MPTLRISSSVFFQTPPLIIILMVADVFHEPQLAGHFKFSKLFDVMILETTSSLPDLFNTGCKTVS
jgi:hypothetical protein